MNTADLAAESHGVFPMHPLQAVAQTKRLVADERGQWVIQAREAGEINRGNAERERIGRNSRDSKISSDVVLEGIVAENLSAAPAPVQLRVFHQVRAPVVGKPQSHGLVQT